MEMETKPTNIEYLRKIVVRDIKDIPYFIDTKRESHKNLWQSLQLALRIISKCMVEEFLSERKLGQYVSMMLDTLTNILNSIDSDLLEMEINFYIVKNIESYEKAALRLELFESCQNLAKFKSKIC